jgi:hypothetical protein
MKTIKKSANNTILILICMILMTQSTLKPAGPYGQVRAFTRMIEFDFIRWTLDALWLKQMHESVRAPDYMSVEDQRNVVFEYLQLVQWVNRTTAEINRIYADPEIANPELAAADLNDRLEILLGMEEQMKPVAESILQHQVSIVVSEMDLGLAGQPIPPVLYHTTRLPNALIVSPRDVIRQDANISLMPEITTEEINRLEDAVAENLDVSALVVPIGGVGTYPTMVRSTTSLVWLTEVVAHEWIHNYLTLRPLGSLYMASPQLRTINETTANIAGKEIGYEVMLRFYPEHAPPPPPSLQDEPEEVEEPTVPTPAPEEDPDEFNFNREMNRTRVQADQLLLEGKVEEAEEYMEMRRRFFWENGYQIRKLNQAYFAFHGAYSDAPGGGAAGRDPVGPTVQELRRRSSTLTEFLNRIAWVTSFDALVREVERVGSPISSEN